MGCNARRKKVNVFNSMIASVQKEHSRLVDMYSKADQLVLWLGIHGVLTEATQVSVIHNGPYRFDDTESDWPKSLKEYQYDDNGSPFVSVWIYIPADMKDAVRGQLVNSNVDRWKKSTEINDYSNRRPAYLISTWKWSGGGDDYYRRDSVEIKFYEPVKAGDTINGCKVTEVESIRTELNLVCNAGSSQDEL
jgi:hypothetical protein